MMISIQNQYLIKLILFAGHLLVICWIVKLGVFYLLQKEILLRAERIIDRLKNILDNN